MNRAVTLPRRALRRHDAEGAHRRTDSSRQACKPEVLAEPLPVQESVSDATIAAPELPPYLRMRRSFDQVVALLLLIVCSPLLLALILLVRLTSKGRAIYTQERVGLHGRVFTVYKFRSMQIDAEKGTGAVWSQPGDPRVTPVGRLLRWSHLDELPQLVNILRGEMALIGPRPERPELVEVLERKIPEYRTRLQVLPGVTGLAQVSLPPDSDLDSVRRKTVMDIRYIQDASLALDIHILFCTVMLLFGLQRRIDVRVWQAFA
ncbi:MAG: sugar transferase [Pirellulaceae bacterium]|nr:sugar transferase [Pirellulaceae bacterium]